MKKSSSPYRPLIYLACPYSSPEDWVKQNRFDWVTAAAAKLMGRNPRLNIFSPITNSHPLHLAGLAGDWKTWKRIDTQYLRLSKELWVLMLEGWDTSIGVTEERKIARRLGIPIRYLNPATFEFEMHEFQKEKSAR